jgi:UDP-N-acetylmuramyl pentapeptide phosphotransferase/UDP-N-acetylglucosamine-1-phosphate transferase
MTALLALPVGAVASWLVSVASLRLPGPVSRPVADRWHCKSTPLTGGFGLLSGFLLALGAAAAAGHLDRRLWYVALAGTGAFVLGLSDDNRWIGPRTKFAGQLAIAGSTASVIHPAWLPTGVGIPLGALVLVAAMNSFNFLDNIDGLAAGTAAIAAGMLALTTLFVGAPSLRVLGCAVVGACLGFLPLNYRLSRPAVLFMGDSGAHLLGLLIGACALLATPSGAGGISASVVAPLLILALPILDTSLVIIVRLAERRPIWRGGRDHLSHRLVYVGLREHQAVAALLLLAAASAGTALIVVAFDDALVTGAAAGAVIALLIGLGSRLALVSEASAVAALPVRREEEPLELLREHAQAR